MNSRTSAKSLFAIGLLLTLGACGCGGSGTATPSIFVGTFVGTWTDSGGSGPEAWTVSSSGHITGTFNQNGTIVGNVQNDGNFTATLTNGAAVYNAVGTVSLNAQNHLIGQDTFTGTSSGTETFDLTKQ